MKRILAVLLAVTMLLSLAACGITDELLGAVTSGSEEAQTTEYTTEKTETTTEKTEATEEAEIPTEGAPIDWPENEYTALVPTPDVGGKVLTTGVVGDLCAIELEWTMEQGVAYAVQLQEAGFGDDCAEKYEKQGYIDRTVNGVNVQLLDLFGVVSLSIMKAE